MTRTLALNTLLIGATLLTAGCDLSGLAVPSPVPSEAEASIPASPTSPPSPSFVRPTPTPLPTFLVYIVRRGDTLSSIAAGFGTKAQSVAYWNRAMYPSLDPDSGRYDPNTIQVGWTLRVIPNAEVDPEDLPPAGTPAPTPAGSPTPSSS
jgi:Tfp pilus assembly protein FimV